MTAAMTASPFLLGPVMALPMVAPFAPALMSVVNVLTQAYNIFWNSKSAFIFAFILSKIFVDGGVDVWSFYDSIFFMLFSMPWNALLGGGGMYALEIRMNFYANAIHDRARESI